MNYENFVIVISAPSGAGKSTIVKKLLEWRNDLKLSVSATTRLPRGEEKNGVEYYFLSKEDFEKKIENSEFVEYAKVHDNYYGTLKSQIDKNFENNINVVLDIDWQGARKITEKFPSSNVLKIFILPPNYKELENRLRNRATDDEATIQKRLLKAKEEMLHYGEYEFIVINDDLEQAFNEVKSLIISKQIKNIDQESLKNFVASF